MQIQNIYSPVFTTNDLYSHKTQVHVFAIFTDWNGVFDMQKQCVDIWPCTGDGEHVQWETTQWSHNVEVCRSAATCNLVAVLHDQVLFIIQIHTTAYF